MGLFILSAAVIDGGPPEKLRPSSANSPCSCGLGRGSLSAWGQAKVLQALNPQLSDILLIMECLLPPVIFLSCQRKQ